MESIENEDINLLGLFGESDEISIYATQAVQDLTTFKWDTFGYNFHLFGLVYHMVYMSILFWYTAQVYCYPPEMLIDGENIPVFDTRYDYGKLTSLGIILLAGILYPFLYECRQMSNGMVDYFSDSGNFVDIVYIFGSVAMAFLHIFLPQGPYDKPSKFLMIMVITLAIRRTFNYMRIFNIFAPLITMLNQVIFDLNAFLLFYLILILLLSLCYSVMGIANPRVFDDKVNCTLSDFQKQHVIVRMDPSKEDSWQGHFLNLAHLISLEANRQMNSAYVTPDDLKSYPSWGEFYRVCKDMGQSTGFGNAQFEFSNVDVPGYTYYNLRLQLLANFMDTLRVSIGDYGDILARNDPVHEYSLGQNYIFWILWLLTMFISNIIFLNFIVAEASNSYNEVNENLDEVIQKAVSDLTAEAEDCWLNSWKKGDNFPKYLISRVVED